MDVKNCPHCNSAAHAVHNVKASLNLPGWIVGCTSCDDSAEYIRFDREVAIKNWNEYVDKIRAGI